MDDFLTDPASEKLASLNPVNRAPQTPLVPVAEKPHPDIPVVDRALHAMQARLTGGLSPAALNLAWTDWFMHLAGDPGRRMRLAQQAAADTAAMIRLSLGMPTEMIEPAPGDHRFDYPGWNQGPFALAQQKFLRTERWWEAATTGVPGVSRHHERIVAFVARQMLDMLSPSNMAALNPEVLAATQATGGVNWHAGLKNFVADLEAAGNAKTQPLPMLPGRDVAITPGSVIFRNELIELIQYSPTTKTVRHEPILIVPAWIMKYYILDLSPHNSMVRYLTGQGFTVFCISWRNPDASMRDTGLDDYRRLGVMAAIDAVSAVCDSAKIHATGYCLGGTLLAITAATMARDHDERFATVTLLAAQTDFTEAGELQLFINESQLAFLDDTMWAQGYLDSSQMAGAFQMLRANDLIWSHLVRRYYLGEAEHPNDMMSWNTDATRMPFRMHSEYLHWLFENNDLAEGRFIASGRKISLADIHVPFFVIGTETDHIAPWRSVYKLQLLNSGDFTFVLTSGGHNAGVVSEPGHRHRHYALLHRPAGGLYVAPEEWSGEANYQEGSWWPAWTGWLAAQSGAPVAPPEMGAPGAGFVPLEAAPGQYILQR
ncbi:MAG: poly-beta-hydroxybutyrate polymerase [Acidocella sp. 20-63-7]|nr:MAG: poly-beta-hydroxybutyrate polymerase [Acidocella sp. 20-63-7]HQT45633.1 alpha/beta fold hydrolase [Acidocella sp.]